MMSINATPTEPVTRKGEPLEFVEDFTYPCSIISKDNWAQKGIKESLGKTLSYYVWAAVLASG